MIRFEPKDKVLRALIDDSLGSEWHLEHPMTHSSEAKICSAHFQKELDKWLKRIRKEAYESGYKDGKQKQKKISDFSPFTDPKIVGWK